MIRAQYGCGKGAILAYNDVTCTMMSILKHLHSSRTKTNHHNTALVAYVKTFGLTPCGCQLIIQKCSSTLVTVTSILLTQFKETLHTFLL